MKVRDKRQRAKLSRGKGKRGEREVAKLLAEWWGQLEEGCEFKSTPVSGGWGGRIAGANMRAHFKASGDLMTTATKFPYTVEVKNREGWSLTNVASVKPSPVWEWWRQACHQAEEQKGKPMLWFKKNNWPWLVAMVSLPDGLVPDILVNPSLFSKSSGLGAWCPAPRIVFAERILELDPERFI